MRPPIPAIHVASNFSDTSGMYRDTGPPPVHTIILAPYSGTVGSRTYHKDAVTRVIPSATSQWRKPTAWNHYDYYSQILPGAQVQWNDTSVLPGHTSVTTAYGANVFDLVTLPSCNIAPLPSWEKRCIVGALAKLQDQQVNLATNLVERKQTEELVAGVIKTIVNQVKRFRAKKPISWAALKKSFARKPLLSERRAGVLPDEWLKLQYGWNPLMQDVEGAFSKIEKREADGLADRVTVKKNCADVIIARDFVNVSSSGNHCGLNVVRETLCKAHISLTYRMTNFPLAQFSSLGLVNPLYLIWEELPFSFVVDWFAPIGNVMNSWTANFGWTFIGGCFSTQMICRLRTESKQFGTQAHNQYFSLLAEAEGNGNLFSRKIYATSPVAGFYLKNPLSSLHVSEALSLLIQVFR